MARLFVGGLPPAGVEIERSQRRNLRWSSVVPGGDDRASWEMDCSDAATVFEGTLPDQLVEVRITGSELMDILWIGWLPRPVLLTERDALTVIDFQAEGYQYSGLVEPFEEHVKYGPASVGSSSLDKVVTTDVVDAMSHARTQKTPLITGERFLSGAGNFDEDTESFFGKTAVDVWNYANNIIGYFANPLYWQVYAINGEPTLELFPHGGTPDYFEDGQAKSKRLEFDASDVVWRVAAAFGGAQPYVASAAPAIATPYTKGKVLNLETEAKSLTQVTQVADAAVAKLNVVRITGGQLVIDRPLRARYCVEVPPEYLRAGRMIDVVIPADGAPYHTDQPEVGGPISGFLYIMRCEYSEETCEATLAPSPYTDEARAIRMLPFQSSPGLTWGIAFGTFNTPPRYDKLYPEGTSTIPTRGNPNTEPIIGVALGMTYKTDTNHDYGPTGGVYDPKLIYKNAAAANFIIEGLRDSSGVLQVITATPAGEYAIFQPAVEMVVERIVLLSGGGVSGSITLRFHKFTRSTETTSSNFIGPASLVSEQYSETVVANAEDPDPGDPDNRKIFAHGDWIVIEVDGDATNIKQIGIGVMGRKIVESAFPPQAGPLWVNRPASPSYPHNTLW